MKKNYKLSDLDKMEIVKNLPAYHKDIEGILTGNAFMIGSFGVLGSLIGIIIGIFHDPLAFRAIGVGVFASVLCSCVSAIACRKSFKKLVTKKISYKEFKKLEQSGEITKWQKQFSTQYIKCENYSPLINQKQNTTIKQQPISQKNKIKTKDNLEK